MNNTRTLSGGGTSSKQRNSNLELFRIITMLLIVAHHYVVNSGLGDVIFESPKSWQSMFLLLFGAWGKTGINCFVLITGYFMCKSQITLKKFLKLVLEVQFYKLVFYVIFAVAGYQTVSLYSLTDLLLPVADVSGSFVSCYLLFYLLIPFLNILISRLSEKQHLLLILLVLFMYTALGTVPKISVSMNYVSWFVVLYIVSSYFRLYPRPIWNKAKIWGWTTLALFVLSAASIAAINILCVHYGKTGFRYPYWFVSDSNKPLALLLAVSAFLFFKNVKIKQSRFINTVAASCFGVLMIHANSDAMRQWLWQDTLDNVGMYSSPCLILHAVGGVLAVYVICTAIDYLRIKFLEKPFFRLYDRHYDAWRERVSTFGFRFCEKLHIGQEKP